MSAAPDPLIAAGADEIAASAAAELQELVDISSPSGDVAGAERALAVCVRLLPEGAVVERPECSSPDHAPDLIGTVTGTGSTKVMLLGHVDTVVSHGAHQPLRRDGDRLYGTGTVDMKGGDILALGVARVLARRPEAFAELAVLMVTDEEWRTHPFGHAARFAGYDACLCFEGGQLDNDGHEGAVVRRKAAGTLRVSATGRASHSGSAPDHGLNALLALARTAAAVAALHDPHGLEQLSVVPTVMRSGDAFNVVPAAGELIFDLRAQRLAAFDAVLAAVGPELDGVLLEAGMERKWPGMDSAALTSGLLARASRRLGRTIAGVPRGGASDASHFAETIPLTVDGLGPRGGGAHTPSEFVVERTLRERAEVALAVALEVLAEPGSAAGTSRR
ncbi:MAG TPA: M20/M25/M40 family metallo-hydrolase [Solirubrobacteraceae bacterium]|jgi:glutamate carboxypeptidase